MILLQKNNSNEKNVTQKKEAFLFKTPLSGHAGRTRTEHCLVESQVS